jgi:hypothetical protein
MPNYSSSPLERVFIAPQTVLRTIPNSAGAWTNTGAKLIPHNKLTLTPGNELVAAPYKTGNTAMMAGHLGRKAATWSLEAPIRPSGSAGTPPDIDMLLATVMGAIGSVSAGVSVTYNWTDVPYFLLMLAFNKANTTNTQRWAFGSICTELSLNLGGGDLVGSFSMKSVYAVYSDNFSAEDTIGKAGLTAVPTEPGSPTIAGANILAYTGSASFGGSSVAEFLTGNIVISTGRDLVADGYADQYPFAPVLGRHMVNLRSLKFLDSDGAALSTVKQAAFTKTPLNVVIVTGTAAGYIITHTLKGVQFGNATISENGAQFDVDFGDSPAHTSGIGNLDDYQMVLT